MIKIVKKIINYFELKKVRKELEKLNDRYISIVDWDWKKQGYSKSVTCWDMTHYKTDFKSVVSFFDGINLVLSNKDLEKKVYIMYLPKEVEELIKKYFKIINVDASAVESFQL